MFGIGIPELILIFMVALIFIGPKKLPDLARSLAKGMAEFKRATEEVKENLDIGEEFAEEKEELLKNYREIAEDIKGKNDVEETKDKEESLESRKANEKGTKTD